MNRTKIKNLNEAKLEKARKIFGKELIEDDNGVYVPYEVTEDEINLGTKVTASYTKEVTAIEGFELLKEIKIDVACTKHDIEFTMNWVEDHGSVWIVQRLINNLISVPKEKRVGTGLNSEQKALLKEEIARYRASKKK